MFQRLKGAIDSRIAEEQSRQRQAQQSAGGARVPARRRPQAHNASTPRVSSTQREPAGPGAETEPEPDPADFEPEFAVGDDESAVPSRTGTPRPEVKERDVAPTQDVSQSTDGLVREDVDADPNAQETNGRRNSATRTLELPTEVRVKLRKLERLENKYGDLLKAYRTAHSRIQAVEPFEAALREKTPLANIQDPNALIEYLNQLKLKTDMVMDELKKVSGERDEEKKKAEASNAAVVRLEANLADVMAGTKANSSPDVDVQNQTPTPATTSTDSPTMEVKQDTESSTAVKSTDSTPRLSSFSLFSPKAKATPIPPASKASEDLFSFDAEVPRLEAELQEKNSELEGLQKQVQTLKGDLAVARESTESMVQSLESATRELHFLRDAKEKSEAERKEFQDKIDVLNTRLSETNRHTAEQDSEAAKTRSERDQLLQDLGGANMKLKDIESREADLQSQLTFQQKEVNILSEKLAQKDAVTKDLEDSLAMAKSAERQSVEAIVEEDNTEKRIGTMQGIMDSLRSQLKVAEGTAAELKQEIQVSQEAFVNKPSTKVFGFLDEAEASTTGTLQTREDAVDYLEKAFGLKRTEKKPNETSQTNIAPAEGQSATKKKSKKKKKGKGPNTTADEQEIDTPVKVSDTVMETEDEPHAEEKAQGEMEALLNRLKDELESKASTVDRLTQQIKDQEALQEEIETLRDDLLHQGEEHVEARDVLKAAMADKTALTETVQRLEKELADAQEKATREQDSEQAHKDLLAQFEELKQRSTTMQTDLTAAESLATTRFKDVSDLRELLSKAQPELRSLRNEVAELRTAKEDLKNKSGDLSRLESRHEDLKSEMKGISKRFGEKDNEVKELQRKIDQETTSHTRLEEELRTAQSDIRVADARRQDAVDTTKQISAELVKAKEESLALRRKVTDLEEQVNAHSRQVGEFKDELSMKTALHNSSQSLVQSLRDQMLELSTQAREGSSKAENLEEELAEAQRMLSERTREGQTMRMLLNQAETGTEARIREMKERMDAAIEERDRMEDEASVGSRRMMREVEDARTKAREAQRALKVLEDEKDEMDSQKREWKRKRDELELVAERTGSELEEVRAAMQGLREALDESERQVREFEIQKADLRKAGEESRERIEKLTKANKTLSEELKSLQATSKRAPGRPGVDSGNQSSRTSIDSSAARSPTPVVRKDSQILSPMSRTETSSGLSQGQVDYVYLKNVLLQFLEQRDKGHQKQLIPVLGMLLHFDRKDEQKWMAAISAR